MLQHSCWQARSSGLLLNAPVTTRSLLSLHHQRRLHLPSWRAQTARGIFQRPDRKDRSKDIKVEGGDSRREDKKGREESLLSRQIWWGHRKGAKGGVSKSSFLMAQAASERRKNFFAFAVLWLLSRLLMWVALKPQKIGLKPEALAQLRASISNRS